MDRILVRFEGDGCGAGELTWGQRDIWEGMRRLGSSLGVGGVVPLGSGTQVRDVADMLRFLVGRHQSLRTRLRFTGGAEPRQVVSNSGEVPLEIVDAADGEDPAGVAQAQWNRYYQTEFDYEREWPIRTAVVRHRGRLTHLVALCCHLATDGFGAEVLRADLSSREAGAVAPVTATQPLEQARWQHGPAGRRHSEATLRHWAEVLRTVPARRFPEPARRAEPRFREVNFASPVAHLAALLVARRTEVGSTPVLLAALCVALAEVTGINPVFTQLVVNNRFRPGLADAVSPLCGAGFCAIDGTAPDFGPVVTRTWRAMLRAAKHAYYDPDRMWELVAQIGRERGEPIDRACIFNDRRAPDRHEDRAVTAADVLAARSDTTLRWVRPLNPASEAFFFYVNDVPDTVDILLSVDTHRVRAETVETFLHRMEGVLVEAALAPARG
ncbi:MAG: condensation domain-containing protein [Labedaea sp.]